MADIIEVTITRLPSELVDRVFSYLGASPSAKLITDTLEFFDTSELIEMKTTYIHDVTALFVWKWKNVIEWNIKLQYFKDEPNRVVNVEDTINRIENLSCRECCCHIYVNDFADYEGKCEWCYAEEMGCEVFKCQDCGFRSDEPSLFNSNEYGYICDGCVFEPDDDEDEIDEDEFWD